MNITLDLDVVMWLQKGERGLSSEAIVEHLTGLPGRDNGRKSHPHDPDDLRRCVLLLESCPTLAARFDEMSTASSMWATLVRVWPDLIASMDEEKPGWRKGWRGGATKTYARMSGLRGAT